MNVQLTFDSRTKFVLATLLFSVGSFINTQMHWGWWFSSLLTVIVCGLYAWYIITQRDGVLARLAVFGLAAGFVELLADCWGTTVGGLVYYLTPPFDGGPFILCSPLYMPFAWAVLMVQIGYIGWWLVPSLGMVRATLITTVLGAVNIPSYEFWAKAALLWYYDSPPMLFDIVPYYVIFAEALICLVLPALITWLEKRPWGYSLGLGVVQGFWMWGAGVAGFYLFRALM